MACARSRRPNLASSRLTCVLTVSSAITRCAAISALDSPRAINMSTSVSRRVRPGTARRAAASADGGRARTKSAISRRVTPGARSASPAATTRTAATSSCSEQSLSRKPLAPAASASYTYSSRSSGQHVYPRRAGRPADGAATATIEDLRGGGQPVEHRHPDVHDHHVRDQPPGHLDRLPTVPGQPHHLNVPGRAGPRCSPPPARCGTPPPAPRPVPTQPRPAHTTPPVPRPAAHHPPPTPPPPDRAAAHAPPHPPDPAGPAAAHASHSDRPGPDPAAPRTPARPAAANRRPDAARPAPRSRSTTGGAPPRRAAPARSATAPATPPAAPPPPDRLRLPARGYRCARRPGAEPAWGAVGGQGRRVQPREHRRGADRDRSGIPGGYPSMRTTTERRRRSSPNV